MAWRADPSPYNVFVSEIMLQQTQVARVERRFPEFIAAFPDFAELASAGFADVLVYWSGLGYNRRARYLQEAARIIVRKHDSVLPPEPDLLIKLPGVGAATAGSIAAFAYNVPVVFIETNIRRVFIHHFFPNRNDVHDREIRPLVEATLDRSAPREWYWALMDYGVRIGRKGENPNRRSIHYTRQSAFSGSDRQLRGMILRDLTARGTIAAEELPEYGNDKGFDTERTGRVIQRLVEEGLIQQAPDGTVTIRN